MQDHFKRVLEIHQWLDDVSRQVDAAVIEARLQIDRADKLLNRLEAERTGNTRSESGDK